MADLADCRLAQGQVNPIQPSYLMGQQLDSLQLSCGIRSNTAPLTRDKHEHGYKLS